MVIPRRQGPPSYLAEDLARVSPTVFNRRRP